MNNSNIQELFPPNEFVHYLTRVLDDYTKLSNTLSERIKKAPDGKLRISKCKGIEQNYHITEQTGKNGKYIKKEDKNLVWRLIQKNYDFKLLTYVQKIRESLEVLLTESGEVSEIVNKAIEAQEKYNCCTEVPFRFSSKRYAEIWQATTYKTKGVPNKEQKHFSDGGIPVRSKSEEMIANALEHAKVPFRYEYPVKVDGIWYPDFYCLNVRTRKEYIWEHFGLLDDSSYCERTVQKLYTYKANGYLLGINLFFTMETKENPLTSKKIQECIRKYLL